MPPATPATSAAPAHPPRAPQHGPACEPPHPAPQSALNAPRWLVSRMFLLRLSAQADPAAGRCAGQLEHVVSGRRSPFSGVAELLALALAEPGLATSAFPSAGGQPTEPADHEPPPCV